ncbi:MAG TPA: TonB-dependent receptor [Acidobacteriaceae bacterium]|nr:TonB-dependent receptor [Acidobacteriaceae bacterium]
MKSITHVWRWAIFAVAMFALLMPSAKAQTVYGSITGTVTDPTGAVVPNAKVVVRGEETGTTFNGQATSAGVFRFTQVPIGAYDIKVTAPGFKVAQINKVQVNLQITTSVDVKLQVGTAVQSVTVNANALQLDTSSSDVSGSISDEQYNKLPLALGGVGALRSPEAFIFLLPGNTGPGTANSPNGIFFSKIAGGQDYGAEVLIDGLSQQRSENGSSFDEEAPSVDALRELTVTEAVPPAEYNRTTGGIENFVTKSGTNTYHGSVYDILRNTALDANGWFSNGYKALNCSGPNNTAACRKTYATPVDRKNDYGVTFGGPVWIPKVYNGHNKTFFFFSWEHLNYNLGATTTATVPTPAELSGDFSNPALYNPNNVVGTNPCDNSPVYQGEIFDPTTTKTVNGVECREPFTGNKIPQSYFSQASVNALNYFPAPTNNQVFNNYILSSVSPIANTTLTLRIDANITQKSHLWSSYSSRDNNRVSGTPQILPYPIDPRTWKQDFETHFWRLGWDYSFSPTLLNHLIIGSNRSNSINYAYPIFDKINYSQKLGIGNADSFNFPVLTNGVTTQEGMPNNGDNIDNGLRLVESINWQKGAHSLTFGTDIRYQQYSPINGNSPVINFCSQQTSAYSGSGANGNGLASELLGYACNGSQNVIAHQSRWISWYYSGYVQDDWKVNQSLTLNLGVNYSVDVPRHEAQNFTSNFSPTAIDPTYGVPGALVFGTTCHCNAKWANTYYKDVAPRVGFAYSPPWLNNKTVIRGGAGILYGPLQYLDFGGSMNAGYKSSPVFPSQNGFDPSFQIDSGYPAFPKPPILAPGLYDGKFLPGSYIEKSAGRPAEIYDWDMQVQQQVMQNLILSIGYVGSAGQNLQANNQNINNVPYKKEFATGGNTLNANLMGNPYGVATPFNGYFNLWGNGVKIQQALRPFPQYDFIDSGCCLQSTGHSSYEALLVSLKGQFKNLTLQGSYTWSKNENDSDSTINVNPGQPQVQNPADLHQEKAISVQDVPNTFVVSYLYHLPAGRDQRFFNHGPASYVLGGWQIGGVQRYQNGQPLAFCCAQGIPGWQQAIRYDLVPGTSVKSKVYQSGWKHINPFNTSQGTNPNTNSFFNGSDTNGAAAYNNGAPVAFHDQVAEVNRLNSQPGNNLPYALGNTPRVTNIRMPAWMNEDFSILKDTPIKENVMFELKFDLLNAFNRHLFGAPDTNPADYFYGIPTYQANSPRAIQVTGTFRF